MNSISTRLAIVAVSLATAFPAMSTGQEPAPIDINNRSNQAVKVFYIGANGAEKLHFTIDPGYQFLQQTNVGVTWVFRGGAQNKELRRLTVGKTKEAVTFGADPAPANALSDVQGHPKLGGITLPSGFRFVEKTGVCSLYGGIAGPGGFEITYSVWIVAKPGEPRHSGHYASSQAKNITGKRWYKERLVNGEIVELALTDRGLLVASYPSRGIDLEAVVQGEEQVADALLIMLSITDETRGISWESAQTLIEKGDVKSVTQFHSLAVWIEMANGINYRTHEPKTDAVFDVLKKCGKYHSVAIITQ